MRLFALVILSMLATAASADPWLCTTEQTTGFVFKNNNWESQKDWLKSSQATQTIKLVSEAMNKECTDFNQDSDQFVPAMEAIEAL